MTLAPARGRPAPGAADEVAPSRTEQDVSSASRTPGLWAHRVLLVASLCLWIATLPRLTHAPVSAYGLLGAAGPGFLFATLGIAVSFGLGIRAAAPMRENIAGLLAFVVVTRGTACMIVPLPVYEWTYKHIGVIDHLSTTGHLARDVDIYNNWPGFFSAAAWFSDITGTSFVDVARWFPLVADLSLALSMYAVSRAFGQTQRVAVIAAFGMQVFNWVAQDYYSPQATAFVLALAAVALLLRSAKDPRAAWYSVPLFVAVTITHQLTPFWLCGIAVLLGLTKRIRPRAIGLVYIAIAVAFAAANFKALSPYGLLTGFDPLSNAQSNIPTAGNAGRSFTSLVARGTTASMWAWAVICGWQARRRHEPVWVPVVLAFTSFGLLAGQSYGGEAIFRVLLYSIPGCLLLIAPVVERALVASAPAASALRRTLDRARRGLVIGLAVLAVAGSLQAYYGTWFVNVVDRDGLDAERRLLATAPTNSMIMGLTLGIAERPTGRYVAFAEHDHAYDNALVLQPGILQSSFKADEFAAITTSLRNTGRPVYLIISEGMRRYSAYYGLFPAGAIDRLLRELRGSSAWTTVSDTRTLSIFRIGPA